MSYWLYICVYVCVHIEVWHSTWIIKIHREAMAYIIEKTKHQREESVSGDGRKEKAYFLENQSVKGKNSENKANCRLQFLKYKIKWLKVVLLNSFNMTIF